jgi:uncharacterized phage protein gp47/JayE
MYEHMTFENIMEDVLARVPSTMDKREGSVIWDAIAPVVVEFANAYIALDTVLNETFADTASLYYLVKRAKERGIEQKLANKAILKGEFTPVTLNVPIGSRFSCDNLNYVVTEKVSNGVYKLTCETAGTEGNTHFGILIPVEYIDGLETAELTELLIPAEDDEDVESLRERYFESITSQAYGGNIADYKKKTISISGVGGVKVTPVWNGGGTVKLTIVDGSFGVPSKELIELVQNEIDPVGHSGEGFGLAPIGHVVTVVGIKEKTVNVVTNITYQNGWNWDSTKSYILNAVDEYFKELHKVWDESDNLIVRISQLESKILSCEGVLDVQDTKLNGSSSNLSLAVDEIPVRGTVNGN